jgi:hypothetical protein
VLSVVLQYFCHQKYEKELVIETWILNQVQDDGIRRMDSTSRTSSLAGMTESIRLDGQDDGNEEIFDLHFLVKRYIILLCDLILVMRAQKGSEWRPRLQNKVNNSAMLPLRLLREYRKPKKMRKKLINLTSSSQNS